MRRSLAVVLSLAAGVAVAQALPDDLRSAAALLQPLQRAALEAHARTWDAWTPSQRAGFAARADAWSRLPLAERETRRAEWQMWRRLPTTEQATLREAALRYAALDPASRQALRTQFDALDTSEQQGWRLGPALGFDYPRLQPLLAQVPPGEQGAVLAVLRAMAPSDRARLGVLVQRTPPQARESLRRELMSTSDANRAAWLDLRLER